MDKYNSAQQADNTDFSAVEPDVDEAAFIGDQPSAAESCEIVCDGWRRNDFGSKLPFFTVFRAEKRRARVDYPGHHSRAATGLRSFTSGHIAFERAHRCGR